MPDLLISDDPGPVADRHLGEATGNTSAADLSFFATGKPGALRNPKSMKFGSHQHLDPVTP